MEAKMEVPVVASAAILVPLAIIAAQYAKSEWAAYSKEDMQDLTGILRHYQDHCHCRHQHQLIPFEFDLSGRSQPKQNEGDTLPIYFQLHPQQRVPILYADLNGHYYAPCKDVELWCKHIKTSHLSEGIEEVIGYICEYQRLRDQRCLERKYSYDPVNMFFEELKVWFLQLSYDTLGSDKVLSNIAARLSYLEAVKNDTSLFPKQGWMKKDYSHQIRKTILHITNVAKERIQPIAQDAWSRQSAREHFDKLRLTLKLASKQLLKFAYYIFRGVSVSPNFLLKELREPSLEPYLDSKNFILDAILRHLVLSPAFQLLFPDGKSKHLIGTPALGLSHHPDLCTNDFKDDQGNPRLPLTKDPAIAELKLSDCWISGTTNTKKKITTGVLKAFSKKEHIEVLLKLCAHMQNLSLCYAIADEFFDLAGEGGNLLVYRMAAIQLRPLLKNLRTVFTEGVQLSTFMKTCADDYYNQMFAGDIPRGNLTHETDTWSGYYKIAMLVHTNYLKNIQICEDTVSVMTQKMEQLNSHHYDQYITSKISRLRALLSQFNQTLPVLERPELQNAVPAVTFQQSTNNFFPPAQTVEVAEAAEEKCIPDDSNNAFDSLETAMALLSIGDFESRTEALTMAKRLAKKQPENTKALFLLATTQNSLGELRPALQTLEQLLALDQSKEIVQLHGEINDQLVKEVYYTI